MAHRIGNTKVAVLSPGGGRLYLRGRPVNTFALLVLLHRVGNHSIGMAVPVVNVHVRKVKQATA